MMNIITISPPGGNYKYDPKILPIHHESHQSTNNESRKVPEDEKYNAISETENKKPYFSN